MGVQPAVAWLRYSTVQQAPGNVVPVWRHETTPWRDNLVSAAGTQPDSVPGAVCRPEALTPRPRI